MESRFSLLLLLLISLGIVCSYAADDDIDISPEQYWESALPNTPMPKVITHLLGLEGKSTSVNVGKGGVNVNTGKGKPKGTSVNVGKGGVNVNTPKPKQGGTSVNVGKGGVNVNTPKPKQGGTSVNVGKGGVNVHTGRKGKPVYVGVKPGYSPFNYVYAATETQVHDDPNTALFFLEKDLNPNSKFTLHFPKQTTTTTTKFLPRRVAKSLPFSSQKLPQILTHFSIPPASLEAESIRNTIDQCEAPGIVGEDKFCATSLESMVDFSTSKLGKKVTLVSTEIEKDTDLQAFTVVNLTKKSSGVTDSAVVCHKLSYPYAVFYCHYTQHTRVYKVSLLGVDGTKADVAAACHTDTSAWNPKHLAFQVLKVKPGTVPVCHFLPQDHVVWVSKY
ncbi:BURP domain protein RD22 [Cucumis melo var. makuwa]|uniref:BURP domain protein RD22 n=1 Tax=Cucumis melo var. makuwa TaxID=1194695 RepID=A0A5D3E6R3_CUCMM|nr:BURP domain protein RD22 [Cucumis melo var. makuwa]TYK31336.1 BURP domain protein RD22 [Cucumis melo var. makuwa]